MDLVLTGGPAPVRQLVWTGADPSNPNYWDLVNSVNWLDTGNGKIRRLDTSGAMQTLVTAADGISTGRGVWVKEDESLAFFASDGGRELSGR